MCARQRERERERERGGEREKKKMFELEPESGKLWKQTLTSFGVSTAACLPNITARRMAESAAERMCY